MGDPKRVRRSVLDAGVHVGYVTVVSYPDRDLLPFAAGSPYSEVVVSDLAERHVVLLQRFKEHWLVHCGTRYGTTDRSGELTDAQVVRFAAFALSHRGRPGAGLVEALKARVERLLA